MQKCVQHVLILSSRVFSDKRFVQLNSSQGCDPCADGAPIVFRFVRQYPLQLWKLDVRYLLRPQNLTMISFPVTCRQNLFTLRRIAKFASVYYALTTFETAISRALKIRPWNSLKLRYFRYVELLSGLWNQWYNSSLLLSCRLLFLPGCWGWDG